MKVLPVTPPNGAGCQALRDQVNAMGQAVLAASREREREYDRDTGHGASQGARFP